MSVLATNLTTHPPPDVIYFSWFDYTLFTLMLSMSAIIGIYFGFFGKKQDNVTEYILGGKTMKTFPIAMSLVASHVSGITVLAVPADIFTYGASYWLCIISMCITGLVTQYIYLPIFYKLQVTSSYEYLKFRFNDNVRLLASFLFIFTSFLYLPIVIYIPALAFNQVTGYNIHAITLVVCVICIFYTTIGGLKAVVWTDTLQFTIMIAAMIAVLVLGLQATGSIGDVFQKAYEGGRLYLWNLDPNPHTRTSVWSVIIGMATSWCSYISVSQSCVQKFLSLPNLSNANRTVFILLIGVGLVKSITVITGLIMYVKYADCDPLLSKKISRTDQLLPYFIMDVASTIPGLSGLFIAGVFCAALSTMSAVLNTVAGVIYIDFIKPFIKKDATEKQASDIMKCVVVMIGVISTGMVFLVEKLGSILPLAVSFGSVANGPLLGIFTLAALVPIANSKGTLTGAACGLSLLGWIVFGAQYYKANGAFIEEKLPSSVEGCVEIVNATITRVLPDVSVPWIYKISFYYYCLLGCLITVIVGTIVSFFTGGRSQIVERKYLSPVIYFALPKEEKPYNTVDVALKMMSQN